VVLMILPHLYGAPQAMHHSAGPPEALVRQFVAAVTIGSFMSWLILGALTGYFYQRFEPESAPDACASG
jgi:predicted cobalt transporter CbtA